jgi:ABC-type molybdate transport system ATPase subunit
LVLFGPSGSGKTQFLKMLSGLITPDTGHIRFFSEEFFDSAKGILKPPQKRQLVYVFQEYAHVAVQCLLSWLLDIISLH